MRKNKVQIPEKVSSLLHFSAFSEKNKLSQFLFFSEIVGEQLIAWHSREQSYMGAKELFQLHNIT